MSLDDKMKNKDKLLHWYCFSYIGHGIDDGLTINVSTYTGYFKKNVTNAMILKNKEYAGVTHTAVLIAVSYLGYMTREEFEGVDNEK